MTKELREGLERGRQYLDSRMNELESELIREAMRALGKRKSERKTKACRLNAKKKRLRTEKPEPAKNNEKPNGA